MHEPDSALHPGGARRLDTGCACPGAGPAHRGSPAADRRTRRDPGRTARGAQGKERIYRLPLAYARGVRDLFFEARVEGEAPRVVAAGTLGELGFHRVGNGWRAAVKRSGAASGMVELAIPERVGARASVQ